MGSWDFTRRCEMCGQQVKVRDMRYAKNGKLVCPDCFFRLHGKDHLIREWEREEKKVVLKEKEVTKSSTSINLGSEERVKWKCTYCNYVFLAKASKEVKVCPYCGRQNTLIQIKDVTAGDFL